MDGWRIPLEFDWDSILLPAEMVNFASVFEARFCRGCLQLRRADEPIAVMVRVRFGRGGVNYRPGGSTAGWWWTGCSTIGVSPAVQSKAGLSSSVSIFGNARESIGIARAGRWLMRHAVLAVRSVDRRNHSSESGQ